jgi:hypothetical protein
MSILTTLAIPPLLRRALKTPGRNAPA